LNSAYYSRCRLRADAAALGSNATDAQKLKVYTRSSALQRKIESWAQIQALYIPAVALLRATETSSHLQGGEAEKPEDFELWLPSSLRTAYVCDRKLQGLEWDLRYAQANDALNEVRQSIRLFSHLKLFKQAHIRGQRASTRARSTLDIAKARKLGSKVKYDKACEALSRLGPILGKVAWEDTLCVLHVADMRPLGDIADGQTEGTRDISWIWKSPGTLNNHDAGLQDCK
jgi:hypothetical protein